jgi:hypothetical protein
VSSRPASLCSESQPHDTLASAALPSCDGCLLILPHGALDSKRFSHSTKLTTLTSILIQ